MYNLHMRENTKQALLWIVSILQKNNVRFQISGGFTAKIYGSPRELNDIDIDVPDDELKTILNDVKPYIIFGPEHFRDERWDLQLMTLNYNGQEIDLSGGNTLKICDARTGEWKENPTDFSDIEEKEIFGIKVPVISRKSLVEYKSMLVGQHQKIDIESILK